MLVVLWSVWLRRNEVVFNGRMVSEDRVENNVGGVISHWCREACRVVVGLYGQWRN